MQAFSSAGTSVNKIHAPRIFKVIQWEEGKTNLDVGGGKYDSASEFLKTKGVVNVIYDPYNRKEEENRVALEKEDYDSATLSNVLCVIKDRQDRIEAVKIAVSHVKEDGAVYIRNYTGDGSGVGRQTKKDCWQNNQKIGWYEEEIKQAVEKGELPALTVERAKESVLVLKKEGGKK